MGAGIAGEIGLVSIVATCEQGYLRGFAFVLIGLISKCVLLPLFGIFGFGIERFRATKAMTGHALGAAGVNEAIYSILMMENDFIAPSINIETLDESPSRTIHHLNTDHVLGLYAEIEGFGGL